MAEFQEDMIFKDNAEEDVGILFQLHHNYLNQINLLSFLIVGDILQILPQKDEICL